MSVIHEMAPPKPVQEEQDSEDDSEDDDFAPEQRTEAKRGGQADNSDDEDSDAEPTTESRAVATSGMGNSIDEDEVVALKREREQMIEEAGGEHRLGKRRRGATKDDEASATAQQQSEHDATIAAQTAHEAWTAMKNVESTTSVAETNGQGASHGRLCAEDMVSVPHIYKFAGETHTSSKLLPRSHPEAVSYLASLSSAQTTAPSSSASSSSSTEVASTTKPLARPGPRKKKSSLASLAAAASTSKPTKLNTLEKSKLDWESFKQTPHGGLSQQERDEIEQQTKSGASGLGNMKGYLERQDFLDRVRGRTGQPDK